MRLSLFLLLLTFVCLPELAWAARSSDYCTVARRCAFITVDAASGTVIEQRDPDKRVFPASLTKLMTAYMLFEALEQGKVRLSDRVRVSAHAASMPALKLGLREGQLVTIEDALKAITIRSANDASVVVAEAISGSESAFANRMTRRARELGLNRTTFRNSSGLPDPNQITTARDMAKLAERVLSDFPKYRRYFTLTEAHIAGRTIEGHNNLLKAGEIDGGKTGYIRDSGFNLVAWTERDGRLLVGAIFGGRTAAARDAKLSSLFDTTTTRANRVSNLRQTAPTVLPRRKPETVGDIIAATDTAGVAEAASILAPSVEASRIAELDLATLAPAATPSFGNSWGIQIGAYRDEVQAQQALQAATRKLPTILGAAYPRTVPTSTTVGQLHRAQIIGLDERQAKIACVQLSRQGVQCLTLGPGGQPS
jgi:D-alanyl-D-alanine carboxypeptidase